VIIEVQTLSIFNCTSLDHNLQDAYKGFVFVIIYKIFIVNPG